MKKIILNGSSLTVEDVHFVAKNSGKNFDIEIDNECIKKMKASNEYVKRIVDGDDAVYGINTGFGALSEKRIDKNDLEALQYNLIRSHCTGVGRAFDVDKVRAMMLLRANCLVSGHSGITPEIVFLILEFLKNDITPLVPRKGSVGASGDLAPLSHIALCLIGEGDVIVDGQVIPSSSALKNIDKNPAKLGPKDGLALINGTAVMAGVGALVLHEATQLVKLADVCAACTNEAVRGTNRAYDLRISKLKPHKGQIEVSENLNKLIGESEIRKSHVDCHKVQDPYSLRCVPQVHGSCRQTLEHAMEVFKVELNSVTDNPLIFVDEGEVISGGNFHGEALALCMDYLAMGLSELCNISERRVEKMMNPNFSDLPAFLTKSSGLNSGLMIAHVTSAALASENKFLCHPASVDSIPTSTDKEDHVSMGVTSARKLSEVLENLKYCLSIEFLCNTQAIEFLRPLKSSVAVEEVMTKIRSKVKKIEDDRAFYHDINNIFEMIAKNEILECVENKVGSLR